MKPILLRQVAAPPRVSLLIGIISFWITEILFLAGGIRPTWARQVAGVDILSSIMGDRIQMTILSTVLVVQSDCQ